MDKKDAKIELTHEELVNKRIKEHSNEFRDNYSDYILYNLEVLRPLLRPNTIKLEDFDGKIDYQFITNRDKLDISL